MIDTALKHGAFRASAREMDSVEVATICKTELIIRVRILLLP